MGPASPLTDPLTPIQSQPMIAADASAASKDAILGWFRGEFAAANAIIDALCAHLSGVSSEYDAVFAAIHRRRLNWIPVLQMQKYHSIAEVAMELKRVTERNVLEEKKQEVGGGCEVVDEEESPESDITDSGSQEMQSNGENSSICSNHEDCNSRPDQIKLQKGFSAKEHMKGHMVNVVKGLKLYEDVFTDNELSKLSDFVNELRVAGQNGELAGETYILFNKQIKGNKRELIQLGAPIFGHIKDEAASDNESSNIEPIPALLEGVVDHLVQWHLIPEYKRPNGCIIHFFDEEEYSQPFLKPPHLEQPISTLLLSESSMVFGRTLVNDSEGNYKGPLALSLKTGSLLVMRGNSADMARHVMCQSPNKRVSVTFFRVRPESNQCNSPRASPQDVAMTLFQPAIPTPYGIPNAPLNGYAAMDAVSKWGVIGAPVVMLAPVRPMVFSPKKMTHEGTGVFLPWGVGSKKHAKHLPPRAQKNRLPALPSPVEKHVPDAASDTGICTEGKSA